MSYQQRVNDHLAAYKRATLGIAEPGTFTYRGKELSYDHILPTSHRYLNLLEPARKLALEYARANSLQLHKYFHHLNSSQAFAFNLFIPYFSPGGDSGALQRAFGEDGRLLEWVLEAVPDDSEGSNIDVLWKRSDGVTICEVKFSEAAVGAARNDPKHQDKLRQRYAPVLRDHVKPEQLEPATFCKSYQFYRNLWHMLRIPNSRLVFLLPRSNIGLWKRLTRLLEQIDGPSATRASLIAIEDVLAKLAADLRSSERMREYAKALAEKYVI